ncbi:hypothetical protein G3580_14505 [Nitrogeniibacter mangrovi]|uniref:PIG-L family deacetylase n=1 Tax=Nitrogeniibacter mangrovi TaxID=2016596 RepID=A0A6C1B7M6_9RHOO|nr:PIG-L family deacetylase [Nitrogeniibacter mangrovi]QID18728.1 hypothetical protein G3580_14505 [Nitrogeniibacter mangrovi]
MKYRAVILSPHLDDAVFSCGGRIASLVTEGPVLVLNLFTEFPEQIKSRAVVLGPERYEEESRAARLLGFESENLHKVDASCRREAYRAISNVFRPPVGEDTGAFLEALRRKVLTRLEGVDFDEIYVPLAIGWHVDHLLTFFLGEAWWGDPRLRLYEDAPYCYVDRAAAARLADLSPEDEAAVPLPGRLRTAWDAMRSYASTAIMKHLEPWPVRLAAVPVTGVYFYRLLGQHRRDPCFADRWRLAPDVDILDHRADIKVDAMMCYASQFREFFDGRDDCQRQQMAYAAEVTGDRAAVERFWRLIAR